MTLSPGSRIGRFEILTLLGAGSMGQVYKARDPSLGREVALKVLPTVFAADPERRRRFENEALAAGQLKHPNLLTVFDIGEHHGHLYLVMELLPGETLRQRMDQSLLPPLQALNYAQQIADGLCVAHAHGIVHRDLKPANLFVSGEGIKIVDFGLAKFSPLVTPPSDASTWSALTAPGTVLGTVGYMSPEQLKGEGVDVRSDVFAFGVILYEMLTGRHPFERRSAPETMSAVLHDQPAPLSSIVPELPQEVERIVFHCLAKNYSARLGSACDLAFQLRNVPSGAILDSRRAMSAPIVERPPSPIEIQRHSIPTTATNERSWFATTPGRLTLAAVLIAGIFLLLIVRVCQNVDRIQDDLKRLKGERLNAESCVAAGGTWDYGALLCHPRPAAFPPSKPSVR